MNSVIVVADDLSPERWLVVVVVVVVDIPTAEERDCVSVGRRAPPKMTAEFGNFHIFWLKNIFSKRFKMFLPKTGGFLFLTVIFEEIIVTRSIPKRQAFSNDDDDDDDDDCLNNAEEARPIQGGEKETNGKPHHGALGFGLVLFSMHERV